MMAFFIKLKVTGNLKTFIKIMVSLKFNCESNDGTNLQLSVNDKNNTLYIEVNDEHNDFISNMILDKSTAIKLSKELRKQIALLD